MLVCKVIEKREFYSGNALLWRSVTKLWQLT